MTNPEGDPTPRTLAQLQQSMSGLRELFEARFDGYDKAIRLLQEITNSQPTAGVIDERLSALRELVEVRFRELKERTDALAISNKNSIDLALQAAEKAATKSEGSFNKQIDALAGQISQQGSSLETRINDTKERLTIIEAGGQGSKQSYGVVGAIATFSVAAIGLVFLILSKVIP